MVEYESKQSWVTIGVILIVMLPLVIGILALYTCMVRRRRGEGSASSWRFDAGSLRRSLKGRGKGGRGDRAASPAGAGAASSLLTKGGKAAAPNEYDADSGFGAGQYRRGVGVDSSPSDLGVAHAPPLLNTAAPESATPSPPDSARGAPQKLPSKYDGVYHTNEPLPGKPEIEFEDKVWDLDESVLTTSPPSSPASPTDKSDKSSAGNRSGSVQTDIF